jgi:hypothetical protein
MTQSKIKLALGDLHDLVQSRAFWEGVAIGFSPQRYICRHSDWDTLLNHKDSVYQSWVEVGDLLSVSIQEFGCQYGKAPHPIRPTKRKRHTVGSAAVE